MNRQETFRIIRQLAESANLLGITEVTVNSPSYDDFDYDDFNEAIIAIRNIYTDLNIYIN